MKKKVLIGIAALGIAAFIAFNVNLSSNNNIAQLTLDNIEAMAQESSTNNTGPGKLIDCPDGPEAKYCMSSEPYPCTQILCR